MSKAASLPGVSPSVCHLMCDESMKVVIANESGRKRQLADKDDFKKPHRPVKLNKAKPVDVPIKTSNRFDTLRKDTLQLGTS